MRLLVAVLLLTGCKLDVEMHADSADFFHAAEKPAPKLTVEARDVWLDTAGQQLARDHGWTLTFIAVDPVTPTLVCYHIVRPLGPLPAEKP